jgi:hypothetical protein
VGTDGLLNNGAFVSMIGLTSGPSNELTGQFDVRPTNILLMVNGLAIPLPYVEVEHFTALRFKLCT